MSHPFLNQHVRPAPDDIEEVLSVDIEEDDFLYRIRRNSRVVYVRVFDGDVLPPDHRTDGYRVLAKLRGIPKWEDDWTTLTVLKSPQGIQCIPNRFQPHGLDMDQINEPTAIFLNILDLVTVSRISYRIFRVRYGTATWIMKIARFKHEIPALQNEVSTYSSLKAAGFPLAPRFIGFVYEETRDRVVGFLMEELSGTTPGMEDLNDCLETVRLLHEYGVLHGDLNRYNFLVTEQGVKIFDFEASTVENRNTQAAEEELEGLAAGLADESEIGKY